MGHHEHGRCRVAIIVHSEMRLLCLENGLRPEGLDLFKNRATADLDNVVEEGSKPEYESLGDVVCELEVVDVSAIEGVDVAVVSWVGDD